MKKRFFQSMAWLAVMLAVLPGRAADITVFAAASLTDSVKQIADDYTKATGQRALFNFGASSTLARQIEEGAPADIFFSADEAKMDALEKKNLILPGTRKTRLSNSLVIIVAADSSLRINSATNLADADVRHIAVADPKTVPAGIYSREYLQKLKLWDAIEPKVIPVDNVRAALAAVESGNIEAGMVYKTDASISKKVKLACEISPAEGPKISYPVAVVKESRHQAAAKAFVDYLNGEEAGKIFERYGFIVLK